MVQSVSSQTTFEQQILSNDVLSYQRQIGDVDADGDPDIVDVRNHDQTPTEVRRNKRSRDDRCYALPSGAYCIVVSQDGDSTACGVTLLR